jgi:hypothetical protein
MKRTAAQHRDALAVLVTGRTGKYDPKRKEIVADPCAYIAAGGTVHLVVADRLDDRGGHFPRALADDRAVAEDTTRSGRCL